MCSLFHHLICVVTLLLTISSLSECLRIRRSGVAGYDDPYGLTNAFSGMDRPRREDYRKLLRKRVLENDNSYFNPNAGYNLEMDPLDYLRTSRYSNNAGGYLSDYDFQRPSPSYETLERYPVPLSYGEFNDRSYGPQKRTAYKPNRVVPTLDELRSIFGEADVPMKRLAVKRQEPAKKSEEIIEAEQTVNNEKDIKDKTDLAKEWGKLINAAEQLTKNTVNTETVQGTSEEDTDKEEIDKDLEEALSNSDIGDDTGDALENIDDDGLNVDDSESPLENIINEKQAQSKSKRASSVSDSSDYVLGLLKEISDLKRNLYAQEMLKDLLSRENDYLANAIKYATMDQIHESDRYVMNEYNDIAKATETEELIQQLSDGLEVDDDEEEESIDTTLDELMAPEAKRSDVDTYEGDQWLEAPTDESVGLGALLEDENNDDELNAEDFAGLESPIDVPYPDDESEDDDNDTAMETAVVEIANGDDGEGNLKGQEFLLAKLVSNLSPGTLERVISDLEEREAEDGVCSPVLELSQNCAFADAKGIPIDTEARNLCIRHQICYTCGEALEISPERCDNGYKGTVIAECGNDVKCVRAAAFFLHLMTSRFHTFEEYSPQECRNPCVADFIYGV